MTTSPCIKVCQKHTVGGLAYCVGCYRTMEEIEHWNAFEDHIKNFVIRQCSNRRNHITHDMGFRETEIEGPADKP